MRAWKLSERQLWALEALLLMGMAAASVWVARADEWHPAALVGLLIFVAFGGEWFTVEALTGVVSASLAVTVCPAQRAVAVAAIDFTWLALAMPMEVKLDVVAAVRLVTMPFPPHPPPLRPDLMSPVGPV